MKMIIALLSAASFLAASAFAQDATQKVEEPTKKTLTAEDIAGKTFVYLDGAWGQHNFYFRKDGTFKVCGGAKIGCDEGRWVLMNGKLERVYNTWFKTRNHRPAPTSLTVDGSRGIFGSLSARVYAEGESLPGYPYYDDPRK